MLRGELFYELNLQALEVREQVKKFFSRLARTHSELGAARHYWVHSLEGGCFPRVGRDRVVRLELEYLLLLKALVKTVLNACKSFYKALWVYPTDALCFSFFWVGDFFWVLVMVGAVRFMGLVGGG